jgi:hypothetical protein
VGYIVRLCFEIVRLISKRVHFLFIFWYIHSANNSIWCTECITSIFVEFMYTFYLEHIEYKNNMCSEADLWNDEGVCRYTCACVYKRAMNVIIWWKWNYYIAHKFYYYFLGVIVTDYNFVSLPCLHVLRNFHTPKYNMYSKYHTL